MKNTNKKGFTIVELVIVIAVIAILSAVLIPTFSGVVANAKNTAAVSDAKAAYQQYLYATAETSSEADELNFVYKYDDDAYVLILDGQAYEKNGVKVFKTEEEAAEASGFIVVAATGETQTHEIKEETVTSTTKVGVNETDKGVVVKVTTEGNTTTHEIVENLFRITKKAA